MHNSCRADFSGKLQGKGAIVRANVNTGSTHRNLFQSNFEIFAFIDIEVELALNIIAQIQPVLDSTTVRDKLPGHGPGAYSLDNAAFTLEINLPNQIGS